MELYILSKVDLSILSIAKLSKYQINLDEETNAKSTFTLLKTEGLVEGNFLVLNGLFKQFLFVIPKDGVQTEKDSNIVTVTGLDISNIFDRKVVEKDIDTMTTDSIEEFIANTISENFVNSDDTFLNIDYIEIYWHTSTQANVATNAENGLYNFHTFLINCRQYKNIYTEFKFDENKRLVIDITNKTLDRKMIDTTLPEVVDYNKVYEEDVTAKVTVLIRENNSIYNLYLKTDRTTTTNKNDPNRAKGKIEVISVDTADMAESEALNVIKGNTYNHLVEFKIAKTSKLMDITQLTIGRPILIKTNDDVYESYISAITLTDENFVYFKSGKIRITLLDKLKQKETNKTGNKLDVSGGVIKGDLKVEGRAYFTKEICTAFINRKNFTNSTVWGNFSLSPFDTFRTTTPRLIQRSNGIEIGQGVSKILISANCKGVDGHTLTGDIEISVQKNGNSLGPAAASYNSVGGGWHPLAIAPQLFECEEGDLITFIAATNYVGTFEMLGEAFTIEIIE